MDNQHFYNNRSLGAAWGRKKVPAISVDTLREKRRPSILMVREQSIINKLPTHIEHIAIISLQITDTLPTKR